MSLHTFILLMTIRNALLYSLKFFLHLAGHHASDIILSWRGIFGTLFFKLNIHKKCDFYDMWLNKWFLSAENSMCIKLKIEFQTGSDKMLLVILLWLISHLLCIGEPPVTDLVFLTGLCWYEILTRYWYPIFL